VAVSDRPGTATLYLAPDINTGGSGLSNAARYPVRAQPTSLRTLSQLLNESGIDQVDLMKVDIEGFEWEMLAGAPEVFSTHRVRAMAMEIHESLLLRRGLDAGEILRQPDRAKHGRTGAWGEGVGRARNCARPLRPHVV
jgi:hypothetical protein